MHSISGSVSGHNMNQNHNNSQHPLTRLYFLDNQCRWFDRFGVDIGSGRIVYNPVAQFRLGKAQQNMHRRLVTQCPVQNNPDCMPCRPFDPLGLGTCPQHRVYNSSGFLGFGIDQRRSSHTLTTPWTSQTFLWHSVYKRFLPFRFGSRLRGRLDNPTIFACQTTRQFVPSDTAYNAKGRIHLGNIQWDNWYTRTLLHHCTFPDYIDYTTTHCSKNSTPPNNLCKKSAQNCLQRHTDLLYKICMPFSCYMSHLDSKTRICYSHCCSYCLCHTSLPGHNRCRGSLYNTYPFHNTLD